jgi:hypothetical protein
LSLSTSLSTPVQPNRITLTVVMRTLCQNLQPHDAARILQDMLDTSDTMRRPDNVAFSVLLDGWATYAKAHCSDEVACRQAVSAVKKLLQQMKDLGKQWPDMLPNERTYTSVFKTLAASQLFEASVLARDLLAEMWQTSTTAMPCSIHYNAVLDCCARVPRATKAVDAASIWQEMMTMGIACDTITYNSLLNAAANSFGSPDLKRQSLQIGRDAWHALLSDDSCQPSSLTYNYYFKMVRRLSCCAEEKIRLFKVGFDSCCEHGCLNEFIWRQLMDGLTDAELKSLLGTSRASCAPRLSELPLKWSRNAMGTRKRQLT